jgi:serine protease Do
MFAAYGRVTDLYPCGRDHSNPTPVFEVEADWPSGMSGGPVFDAKGEVIGLVSRGLSAGNKELMGHAWAIWFEKLPHPRSGLSAWMKIHTGGGAGPHYGRSRGTVPVSHLSKTTPAE